MENGFKFVIDKGENKTDIEKFYESLSSEEEKLRFYKWLHTTNKKENFVSGDKKICLFDSENEKDKNKNM